MDPDRVSYHSWKVSYLGKDHISFAIGSYSDAFIGSLKINKILKNCHPRRRPRESNIFNLCGIRPPEICVNLVFKHIHAASNYTICR